MAEKRRAKKRKDEYSGPGGVDQEIEKASKEEYKVAKWLKANVPTKKTKFLNHNVEYFSSIKAIDALLASKFAQGDNCLFPHRQAAIDFMADMLYHKFFHRARKVPVSEQELRGKSGSKKAVEAVTQAAPPAKDGGKTAKEDPRATDAESSHAEGGSKVVEVAEKRKRKIRLEMHPEQVFIDGHEAYVWLYDPIPMHYWIFGALLVVGAIVICLFPLWPPLLRKGVYYLSIAAAGFLVFILGLVVLRCIIFCLVWVVTGGKHHFWLLPNLTEDVGFFASFWPLYNHEYKDGQTGATDKSGKKTKKRKRDKDSGGEEEGTTGGNIPPTIDEVKERDTEVESVKTPPSPTSAEGLRHRGGKQQPQNESKSVSPAPVTIAESIDEEQNSGTPSESDSEGSQRSSTGKDFEMVEPDEVDTS